MITKFSELAFLSNRDLSYILAQGDNATLLIVLFKSDPYTCDSFTIERIPSRFPYAVLGAFEMDQAAMRPSMPEDVVACQYAIIEIANHMIVDCEFSNYYITRIT